MFMYVKLLGESGYGLPQDCTVGKVYEIVNYEVCGAFLYFITDTGRMSALCKIKSMRIGNWQIVDKEGNVL